MEDTVHHKQLRQKLINHIHQKGINDIRVLEAMNKVPRHLFIENSMHVFAYEDAPQEIGQKQTISQPYTVAYQTELLTLNANDKILEIGTGSGYQSAVLFEMATAIFTIERQRKLYDTAKKRLIKLGYSQINVFYDDGTEGLNYEAPFDKILITAAVSEIPHQLIKQLKINGIMVAPVGREVQKMLRITKINDTAINVEEFEPFRFVPLLPGVEY